MRGIRPWNARPFFTILCIDKGSAPYKKVIGQCSRQNHAALETTVRLEAAQCSYYLLKWCFNNDSNVSKSFCYDGLARKRENGIPAMTQHAWLTRYETAMFLRRSFICGSLPKQTNKNRRTGNVQDTLPAFLLFTCLPHLQHLAACFSNLSSDRRQ